MLCAWSLIAYFNVLCCKVITAYRGAEYCEQCYYHKQYRCEQSNLVFAEALPCILPVCHWFAGKNFSFGSGCSKGDKILLIQRQIFHMHLLFIIAQPQTWIAQHEQNIRKQHGHDVYSRKNNVQAKDHGIVAVVNGADEILP